MKLSELVKDESNVGRAEVRDHAIDSEKVSQLESILTVVRKLNSSLILTEVLAQVIQEAIEITHADRGYLMLSRESTELEYILGRMKNGDSIPASHFAPSRSIVDDVYQTGESACIEDAMNDGKYDSRPSVMDLRLRTVYCSPMRIGASVIGVIYVDSRSIQPLKKEEVLQLFEILAGQAAIAIHNAKLYAGLERRATERAAANVRLFDSLMCDSLAVAIRECRNSFEQFEKANYEEAREGMNNVLATLNEMVVSMGREPAMKLELSSLLSA